LSHSLLFVYLFVNEHVVYLPEPEPSKVVWYDEFSTDGPPDSTKWKFDTGDGCAQGICGWGNNEEQYYTDSQNNAFVSNGALNVAAKREQIGSSSYSSARLVSNSDWRYGRIRARASLSKCTATGTWPAIWALPTDWVYGGWPKSGEIDIMEHVGFNDGKFHGTVHTEAYNHAIGTDKGSSLDVPVSNWHIFEINWTADKIQFAIDNLVYFEFEKDATPTSAEWPFDQDFHLLFNVAVGGMWGGSHGVDSAAFVGEGQVMQIDWIRVYSP
jgi:beta-glucanase (GH16 family)